MRVKIAKDITRYKEKLFFGLSMRQMIAVALILVINIPIYIFLRKYLGDNTTGWVIMITTCPLVLFGWFEPQGMTFEKYLLAILWSFIAPPIRPYKVEESKNKISKGKSKGKKIKALKKGKKITIPVNARRVIPFSELFEDGLLKIDNDIYSLIFKYPLKNNKYEDFNIFSKVIYEINREIQYQEIISSKEDNRDVHIALSYKVNSDNNNPESILMEAFKIISNELKNNDISCERLNAKDILELFNNIYNPLRSKDEDFLLPKDIYSIGKKIRKYLAPTTFNFKEYYIEMGSAYSSIHFARILPENLDEKLVDSLLEINDSVIVSKHIRYIDKNERISMLQEKITAFENKKQEYKKNKNVSREYALFAEESSIDEDKKVIELLESDNDMFGLSLYISVTGESMEQLNELNDKVNAVCRANNVSVDIVTHKQYNALASILPLANDKVGVKRNIIVPTTCINYQVGVKDNKEIKESKGLSKFGSKKRKDDKKLEFKKDNKRKSNAVKLGKVVFKNPKSIKIPKYAQSTIPFEELYDNGMFKVEDGYYSIVMRFSNINYMLSREDEKNYKFKLYANVLHSIAPDINYQEIIMNEAIDEDTYRDCLIPKTRKDDNVGLIHDDYIKVQEGFIEESGNATADKKTYIALGYKVKSESENPYNILKKAFKDVQLALKKLESPCEMLKPNEILELFYNYFNPTKSKEERLVIPENFASRGYSIKDFISPSSFKFKNSMIGMGKGYTRIFYVRDYPEMLEDVFISSLMDNSYDIVVTKHVEHIEKGSALQFLQRKMTSLESQRQDRKKKNKREGTDYIPYELKNSIKETDTLLESLKNDQDMFIVRLYISVSAETQEMLDDICRTINTVCRQHMIKIDVISHRQEQAVAAMLPLANDKVSIIRRMTTDATAVLIPFSAQNIFQRNGFYYGRNSLTNSMIIIDRKKLKNGNGFVLGVPGSGKSLKEKREIIDVLELTDDDVIIIDPEDEFGGVCVKYNGELIKISASTDTHLNPMDISMDYADDEDPIQMKSDFILSIIETLKGQLDPIEKTIVDRCVRLSYKEFIDNGWNQEYIPTFENFYNILKEQVEPQAQDIALSIELYVLGSLNTFSHKSNVSLKNRLTVINTKDLGKNLKKLGLLVVLDSVWNILCANKEKGKNTWIITDEFYLFFDDRDGKDSYSADYYYMIYKRSRKYGGMVTGITQNVEDLLQSPKARTMLANSQFITLLDQAPTDRAVLKKLLNLSDSQENFVTNAERGCGLMIVGKDIIPFEDEYPKNNEVYKTITTNLQEIREYKRQEQENKEKERQAMESHKGA